MSKIYINALTDGTAEVRTDKSGEVYKTLKNEPLSEFLARIGIGINAACGGNGRCGKCRVRVINGNAAISSDDSEVFTPAEIGEGWRLSCRMYPTSNLTIECGDYTEESFEVLTGSSVAENNGEVGVMAIDIGTTTIAAQLTDKNGGCEYFTAVNRQRRYGADVISRIQAATGGKETELRECIREDLCRVVSGLCDKCGFLPTELKRVVISCNTVMGHILMGYDCSGLGRYPFEPVNINHITGTCREIIGIQTDTPLEILPGISAYIGGDIVSGLYACGFCEEQQVCLFVDLGTNGEMAVGNKEKILTASVAAGPAFEGGCISCGMGSIDGAVCSVKLANGKTEIKTIGNKPPVGICGTGAVELVSEMLRENVIDNTGLLNEDLLEEGFPVAQTAFGDEVVFTQQDIRELQLAKAAIRAGIETLLVRYGISADEIARVYIAGGFGYRLNPEKAIAIGMLPEEFTDKAVAVGNTSLAGGAKYLNSGNGSEQMEKIRRAAEEINLSNDEVFKESYMQSMMF